MQGPTAPQRLQVPIPTHHSRSFPSCKTSTAESDPTGDPRLYPIQAPSLLTALDLVEAESRTTGSDPYQLPHTNCLALSKLYYWTFELAWWTSTTTGSSSPAW